MQHPSVNINHCSEVLNNIISISFWQMIGFPVQQITAAGRNYDSTWIRQNEYENYATSQPLKNKTCSIPCLQAWVPDHVVASPDSLRQSSWRIGHEEASPTEESTSIPTTKLSLNPNEPNLTQPTSPSQPSEPTCSENGAVELLSADLCPAFRTSVLAYSLDAIFAHALC